MAARMAYRARNAHDGSSGGQWNVSFTKKIWQNNLYKTCHHYTSNGSRLAGGTKTKHVHTLWHTILLPLSTSHDWLRPGLVHSEQSGCEFYGRSVTAIPKYETWISRFDDLRARRTGRQEKTASYHAIAAHPFYDLRLHFDYGVLSSSSGLPPCAFSPHHAVG